MTAALRLPTCLLVAAFVLGRADGSAAHKGAIAIAEPVTGLSIDGDLDDWPAGARRYRIGRLD